jgi:hypothetical protein
MASDQDIRTGRHCVFLLHVHLVFVTKYRRGVFTKEILDDLRAIFVSVCNDFEAELVVFDGKDDHVHLRVNYPPRLLCRRWSIASKACPAAWYARRTIRACAKNVGVVRCGHRPILPEAVAAPRLQLFDRISSSSRRRTDKDACGARNS